MGVIEKLEEKAAKASQPMPDDYEHDGLLYCGTCHEPKQCLVEIGGIKKKVPCVCRCQQKEPDNSDRIEQLQLRGGVSPSYTFDRAHPSKVIDACRRYAGKWDDMVKRDIGLLLWGDVGTGKTYAAHCICNELIKRDIPVFVTSFSRVLNSGFDKSETLRRIRETPLVCFDDLGAERSSEYALEAVFMMVDERYRARKPLIVTSNLTLEEMKTAKDIDRKRIYDRILGRCVPIKFAGTSKREADAAELRRAARELLGEE
ncbi:MAG: AAA family ATPase [Clostridium lundense]|nr:AAA family ATPase [Clostridium lundense]